MTEFAVKQYSTSNDIIRRNNDIIPTITNLDRSYI